jgi:hypothetical protein
MFVAGYGQMFQNNDTVIRECETGIYIFTRKEIPDTNYEVKRQLSK